MINHGSSPATVRAAGMDLLTGLAVRSAVTVAAGDVAVVREEPIAGSA